MALTGAPATVANAVTALHLRFRMSAAPVDHVKVRLAAFDVSPRPLAPEDWTG